MGLGLEADLDLTVHGDGLVVGHPGDLGVLNATRWAELAAGRGVSLGHLMAMAAPRLMALELKASEGRERLLVDLLEQLQALPKHTATVWYLPQELPLYVELQRDRYPSVLGIVAVFDRPWRGSAPGSMESLLAAKAAGVPMLGMSIQLPRELLREAVRQGFQVLTFGVNGEAELRKAAASGAHLALSDEPWAVRQLQRQLIDSCDQPLMPLALAAVAAACALRSTWMALAVLVVAALWTLA